MMSTRVCANALPTLPAYRPLAELLVVAVDLFNRRNMQVFTLPHMSAILMPVFPCYSCIPELRQLPKAHSAVAS
jgi:hypothetical protein